MFFSINLAWLGSTVVSGAETANSAKPSRAEVMKRKPHKPLPSAKAVTKAAKGKAGPAPKLSSAKTLATKEAKKPVRPARLLPVRAPASAPVQIAGPTAIPANIAAPVKKAPSLLWSALAAAVILAGAEFLWRRRRHAKAHEQPAEFIEPVFNLDASDLASLRYDGTPASLPPRKTPLRWRLTREADADAWRLAAVEPAF